MHQRPNRTLPISLKRVYGIINIPQRVFLPPDHPCYGCVHCNTAGTVPYCPFFECKRAEYDRLWFKSRKEGGI